MARIDITKRQLQLGISKKHLNKILTSFARAESSGDSCNDEFTDSASGEHRVRIDSLFL